MIPASVTSTNGLTGLRDRLAAIVLDEATIASARALSNDRSTEPIENEQRGPARENVTATTRGFSGRDLKPERQ